MLRLTALFVLFTYGFAASSSSDSSRCLWGESHWCSSLKNAKTCGAFQHCKTTIWKNQMPTQDSTDNCQFCQVIVEDIVGFIKENKTEQEILRFLSNVCQMIPEKALADQCQTVIQNYVPEIIELVIAKTDPKVICQLLKLCQGLEDTAHHSENDQPAPQQSPVMKQFLPLPIKSEPICTDCKKFFTDVKNYIVNNATEAEVEQMIDQVLCARLGAYEDMCKMVVKEYIPAIMTYLASDFDPNLVCQSFGFCAQTLPEANMFLVKMMLMNSPFYKQVHAANSVEGCSICKTVMKTLQDLDRDKAIQTDIEDFLKKTICVHFRSFQQGCNNFIDNYAPVVFQLLATELDPDTRCRSLGFCPASNEIRDPVRESTPSRAPDSSEVHRVSDGPQCYLCKIVVEELDRLIGENKTEEQILAALEKVCKILPSKYEASCKDFIETYGKAILQMLLAEMNPDLICHTLGLCSQRNRIIPSAVSGSSLCIICETVVQYLEALLEENATIATIEAYLEKICNFVPTTYQKECDFLVENYGPALVHYISTSLTPKQVCSMVKACPSDVLEPKLLKQLKVIV